MTNHTQTPGASSNAPPIPLVVEGVRKKFGTVDALAGASFDVRPRELVGLLGPNGAGKTTLIKAVAGRLALDSGSIRLFGRVLTPKDPRPEVGVVPQELAIYPLLSARENLEVFGRLYGVSRAELRERVTWALEWSDLRDRQNEPTKRFSGGMKRRLNIACSLMHRPTLVLLDEPTVGVDPQSRERIYEMLATLQQGGVSIVLTTHHLEEAQQRCERIVIIDQGRTVASGTLAELLHVSSGQARSLTITLARALPAGGALPAGATIDAARLVVSLDVRDGARDIAAAIGRVGDAGGEVADVRLSGATLQDVFISLTGRELRE